MRILRNFDIEIRTILTKNFDEKMNLISTSLKLLLISMAQVTLTTRTFSQSPFIYDYERIQNVSIATKLFPKLEESSKEAEQEYDFNEEKSPDKEEEEWTFWHSEPFYQSDVARLEVVRKRPTKVLQLWILNRVIFVIIHNFVAT